MEQVEFQNLLDEQVGIINLKYKEAEKYIDIIEEAKISPTSCYRKNLALIQKEPSLLAKINVYIEHPFAENELRNVLLEHCKFKLEEIASSLLSSLTSLNFKNVAKNIIEGLITDSLSIFDNTNFLTNKNKLLSNPNTKEFALSALQQNFQKANLAPLTSGININILFLNLKRLVETLMDKGDVDLTKVAGEPEQHYKTTGEVKPLTVHNVPSLYDDTIIKLIQNASTNLTEKDTLYADDTENVLAGLTGVVNSLIRSKEGVEYRIKHLEKMLPYVIGFNEVEKNEEQTNGNRHPNYATMHSIASLAYFENIEKFNEGLEKLKNTLTNYKVYMNNIMYRYFYYRYEIKVVVFIYTMLFDLTREMNIGLSRFNLSKLI